ncbi:helix-turn-helix domain-containing protein [Natrialba taiwanensis]|uniref:Putative DNA binding protein n=1 Tax=Natrialba taiwanensis DSM 12281 TaxID=1230458 RepID=M0AEX2_9EURY|nr:helix-turn-helix domain-containing protein [Natrialba taiwanensis]ELY96422.1 putative DNA binding protein [Natrialba taiwanensis DSM 12281]
MKCVHLTATPDSETVPESFRVLAGSSHATEARLVALNTDPHGRPTELFEVDGNADRIHAALADSEGVHAIETAPVTNGRFNLLVTLAPSTAPLQREAFEAITQEQLVVVKPIVYRDERVRARIVGTSAALQRAIGRFPEDITVEIDAIGEFDRGYETPLSLLSDRQREAMLAAFDLGYYERPRETTHREIADRLGCAPNTVSDHLQKAEKKIVTEVLSTTFEQQ